MNAAFAVGQALFISFFFNCDIADTVKLLPVPAVPLVE
jgi:hypothetical protein